MISISTYDGKNVALFGLGGSGMATALALAAGGAHVVAFDDNPDSVMKANEEGIKTCDLREVDFNKLDALILAPGVPLTHPKPHWTADLANEAGIPIVGDVELFAVERAKRAPDSQFIAITGTNGKSTTTALISHILNEAGCNVQMGGNIGRAVLTLDELNNQAVYVVECSSYQIDLAPNLDPTIGILLNLSPDHLDRHGTMENYSSIKQQLVANSQYAIVGVDDAHCSAVAVELASNGVSVAPVSVETKLEGGMFADDGILFSVESGESRAVASLENANNLRGKHNAQNAAVAWIACHKYGLSNEQIQRGLDTFPGLAHRMEIIHKQGRVLFVNDSKATNADAVAMAFGSFDHIYWIGGGLAKEGGIESLRPYFPKIARAYLIGEAAPQFAATLGEDVSYQISGTLDAAISQAAKDASNDSHIEPVVLMSPACASFDQFRNFEIRGEAFRSGVQAVFGLEV